MHLECVLEFMHIIVYKYIVWENAIWYLGKQVLVNEYDKKMKPAAILELSSEILETNVFDIYLTHRPTRTKRSELCVCVCYAPEYYLKAQSIKNTRWDHNTMMI